MIGWINVKNATPKLTERVLAYTPTDNIEIRYRIIPCGLFRQVAREATHWIPLNEPLEDK